MAEYALSGLVDLVDALLDSGVVAAGGLTIGVADVDLVVADLRLLLTGVQAHVERGGAVPAHRGPARPAPRPAPPPLPSRVDADPDRGDAGLGRLIVVLADLLHRILESQAIARMEGGSLTAEQEERLGRALMAMEDRLATLRQVFTDETHRPKEVTR